MVSTIFSVAIVSAIGLFDLHYKLAQTNDTLDEIRKNIASGSRNQSGSAIVELLGLLHQAAKTAANVTENATEKNAILDAAKSAAKSFLDSTAGGIGDELGHATGHWIACWFKDCEEESRTKLLVEVKTIPLQHCERDCTESLKILADAIRGFSTTSLDHAIDSLKRGIDDNSESGKALASAIVKLQEALKPKAEGSRGDVIIVQISDDRPTIYTPTLTSTMTIRFAKVGSVDDEGQTKLVIERLREILKDRTGCTISVSGHADTLGGDRSNLRLSKKRAEIIAQEIKSAFSSESIRIISSEWGERRLKVWTDNDTAREANRRVEIEVHCVDK